MALDGSEQVENAGVMPDLTWPRHGFHHTADSALMTLSRMGISAERVSIRKAGRGWAPRRVVQQQPAAGKPLTPDTMVDLTVEGDGMFYHLPTGMREASREGQAGTCEIVSVFDDAVEKVAVYVRQGGLLFDVRPGNFEGCRRWIELFGVNPEDWPKDRWYNLAVLLPCLRYLAGRETGLRLALRLLLGIEIASIKWRPRRTLLPEADRSFLANRASRLGVDLILGEGIDDEAAMRITLGPISLAEYRFYQTEEGRLRLERVLRLVAPYHWVYENEWLVGDVNRAPRLGYELENAVLGVNSHLGTN